MAQKFKFLFAPVESVGHFNASIGIAQELHSRGHAITFATPNSWRGKLTLFGFNEAYYQSDEMSESTENWGELVASLAPALALPTIKKMEFLHFPLWQETIKKVKDSHANLLQIVQKLKPDVIVVDHCMQEPALMNQGIPWVFVASYGALCQTDSTELPPPMSGYSVFDQDRNTWEKYREKRIEVFQSLFLDFQSWVLEHGGPTLPYFSTFWHEDSPFANICMYPEEMSYEVHLRNKGHRPWYQLDAFTRKEPGKFEIPEKLRNLPGKLVYLSLGTIGSSELVLMRRLITILSKSSNKFIVSKGLLGDQLELGDNMWGANDLPQTLVLPLVDLVITHGGNNTVTECFYFGKPLLIIPLFVDQLDNATRVQETGHGLSFQPYHVTSDELLDGIQTLLNNNLLKNRMHCIGHRIRTSKSQSRAADIVENVAKENA